jgi:hypothetical protein
MSSIVKYYYFIIAFVVALINVPNAFAEDTLKIDTILDHDFDTYYNFPKQTPLILTGNHDMCPSNDCKMIYDKSVDDYGFGGVTLNVEPNKMTMNGFFKLTGSGYKGILGLTFQCESIDTKTTDVGTTKHVCNGSNGDITPVNEESCCAYYFDFTASFELPSRHFMLNATHTGTT